MMNRMRKLQKLRKHGGFTLLEMITVMLLLSCLLVCVMPTIQQSFYQVQMDTAIVQLHRDIRWAQKLADQKQCRFSVTFFQDKQPYRYIIQNVSDRVRWKTVELPDHLTNIEAKTIFIEPDRTFQKNGHILIQKGEIQRYVYYYQTGRSRVTKKPTAYK